MDELTRFIDVWDQEAQKTADLLNTLPADQYDFRPDAGGRSLGELAWHLAEGDAYITYGIEQGRFDLSARPPGIERPKRVQELAPAFERVHRDAVARVRTLKKDDLDRTLTFFTQQSVAIRDLLWSFVLMHTIHHRGQLVLMCRLAGGTPTGLFGPTREQMPRPQPKEAAVTQ